MFVSSALLYALSWPGLLVGAAAGIVVLLLVLVIAGAVRARRRGASLTPEERRELGNLPGTPLQKRAWWGLGIGAALAAVAGIAVAREGPATFNDHAGLRLLVIGILGAVAVTDVLLLRLPRLRAGRGGMVLDERDRQVLQRAPVVQSRIVLLSLLAWSIALTETYSEAGAIPIVFPYLILLSTLIVHVVAYSAGVLLVYWMVRHDGQG